MWSMRAPSACTSPASAATPSADATPCGEFAQFVDRGFEIAQHLRIGRAAAAKLSILCESSETRASKPARPSAGVMALSARVDLVRGGARSPSSADGSAPRAVAALDPLGERMHVGLQAFERAARQRFVERARDVGEVGAQRSRPRPRRRTGAAASRSASVMLVELPFEAGEIRVAGGCAARAARQGAGASSSARWRAAISATDLIDAEIVRDRRRGSPAPARPSHGGRAGIGAARMVNCSSRALSLATVSERRAPRSEGVGSLRAEPRFRAARCAARVCRMSRNRANPRPTFRRVARLRALPGTARGSARVHSKKRQNSLHRPAVFPRSDGPGRPPQNRRS